VSNKILRIALSVTIIRQVQDTPRCSAGPVAVFGISESWNVNTYTCTIKRNRIRLFSKTNQWV